MSEVRAVTGSTDYRSPPKPRDEPKRDAKPSIPRRDRKSQTAEVEISEPEPRKLNLSA